MRINDLDLPSTEKHTPLRVHCDATVDESTQINSAGFVFKNHNGEPIEYGGCQLGKGYRSCQAEIEAVERCIDVLTHYPQVNHVKLYTDCKPVLRHLDVDTYTHTFAYITLDWVPRNNNKMADLVSQYMKINYAFNNTE